MIDFWEYIKDRWTGRVPKGMKRSPRWRDCRNKFLAKYPVCWVCGSKKKLTAHHIIPFHVAPELELDHKNLMPLCQNGRLKSINCHAAIGHNCDWKKFNPQAVADSEVWRRKINK